MAKVVFAFHVAILSLTAQAAFAEDTQAASAANAAPAKEVPSKFKAADTNGDGGLSEEELAKTDPKAFKLIKANFQQMDKDKDGKVTVEEANKWVIAQRYKFGK